MAIACKTVMEIVHGHAAGPVDVSDDVDDSRLGHQNRVSGVNVDIALGRFAGSFDRETLIGACGFSRRVMLTIFPP